MTLFVVPAVEHETCSDDSATVRRSKRIARRLAAGLHPFGVALREPAGATCGDCVHRVLHTHNCRNYWKCPVVGGLTRGAATDLRLKWPACTQFKGATE